MTAPNTNDTSTPTGDANQAANQDAADAAARVAAALEDQARADAERAREIADRAAAVADAAATRAETIAADTEETETIAMRRSFSVRLPGGGTRAYGPGSAVKVPKLVADIVRSAPTFATSGRAAVDARVRRRQEREFGIQEVATQEATTARTIGGEANAIGGAEGEHDEKGLAPAALSASKGSRARYTEAQQATEAELNETSADDVEAKYKAAVRSGKVKPIADGKGSGKDGRVVKADQVRALVEAEK